MFYKKLFILLLLMPTLGITGQLDSPASPTNEAELEYAA